MSRLGPRYGFEVVPSIIPCVQITEGRTMPSPRGPFPDSVLGIAVIQHVVVKRVYGWTTSHAIARALRWMREHGDPR